MKICHGSEVERGRSLGGQEALSIAGTVAQARTLPQPKGSELFPAIAQLVPVEDPGYIRCSRR